MQLNVFFTPSAILPSEARADDVYIVIDVIRATTTLSVLFGQGARRVLVAGSIEQARQGAQTVPGRLLCGERNVKPIPGFDYGNSPAQFSQLDLSGRELILTTTNGTRAFYACPDGTMRLAGSLNNASAVCAYALHYAHEHQGNLALVCSGELNYFALDDAVCAGYLATEMLRQYEALEVDESATATIALYNAYPPPEVIHHCDSARAVLDAGLDEDIRICMQIDGSTSVPCVVGRETETGLLIIEPARR